MRSGPQNNGLHQTGARGVALSHSSEGQSSLGAPAGEAECSTDLSWRKRLLGAALSLLLPSLTSAEVMDKEPTLTWLWTSAVIFGGLGFAAWRRGPWPGLIAAVFCWLFVWAFAIELDDPWVGPDIRKEAGSGYVTQAYLSLGLCAILHALGVFAHFWAKRHRRQESPA